MAPCSIFGPTLNKNKLEYMAGIIHPAESWAFFWQAEGHTLQQAIAGKHNLLDLSRLDNDSSDFAYKMIRELLSPDPNGVTFSSNFDHSQTLLSLYFSERNREKLSGRRQTAIGYPLVAFFAGGEMKLAPVFIWDVAFEPEGQSQNKWTLTPDKRQHPGCNPWLFDWLKINRNEAVADWYAGLPAKSGWNASGLFAVCDEFCQKAGFENPSQSIATTPQPSLDQLDELASRGSLLWSALLGLFPKKQETGSSLPKQGPAGFRPGKRSLSLLDTDPWQASVLDLFKNEKPALALGKAGSGKTHLLLSFLAEALANEERCLVVSPWAPALASVQQRLERIGLGALSFVLRHPLNDMAAWGGAFKLAAKKNAGDSPKSWDTQLNLRFEQVSRDKNRLDRQYQACSKKVFGDKSWTETVGLFLSSNRIEGKELLGNQLQPQDYSFDPANFELYRNAIAKCAAAFDKVKTLDHPLNNLNAGIFVHQSKQESLNFIQQNLELFLQKAAQFQYRYIHTQNEYGDRLRSYFDQFYFEIHDQITRLSELVKDTLTLYGEDLLKSSRPTLKLYGIFADKYKAALEARSRIARLYETLQKTCEERQLFDHDFLNIKESRSLPKLRANLEKLGSTLEEWRNRLNSTIQEDLTRLSAKTAHPGLGFAEQVANLEDALDNLIDEINGSGLYQLPIQNKMLTLSKRQKLLEDIIQQLETTQFNLRDYGAFYEWQRLWFSLPENARRIVRSIVKVKPNDWVAAFESWFLHQCLEMNYDPSLPVKPFELEEFSRNFTELRGMLKQKTTAYWLNRRSEAIRRFKKENKGLYEAFAEKGTSDFSAGKITGRIFQEVTDCFPVLMVTAGVALDLLEHQTGVWDRVVFLYPEFLPLEPRLPELGKFALGISGQPTEVHPQSLMAGLLDQDPNVFPLKEVHRHFPGNILSPNPGEFPGSQILFEQVDGRYDETAETNEEEARKILDWLNKIEPTKQRTLPSVGIACLTTGQRNLILEYLLRIKQKRLPGVEKIQQLERNGLSAFRADEICGQQFDILIVSSTFGQANIGGALTRHLQRFNQAGGQSAVVQLMTAGKQEIRIANSMPEDNLEQLVQAPGAKGVFLLCSWIRFLHALSKHDNPGMLREWRAVNAVYGTETMDNHPLAEEIAWHIAGRMRTERIRMNAPFGNLVLPLVILPEQPEGAPLIIQPDHFFAKAPSTDFIWEDLQRRALEQAGYRILPAWSVQWWKNPRRESAELLKVIQEPPAPVAATDEEEE